MYKKYSPTLHHINSYNTLIDNLSNVIGSITPTKIFSDYTLKVSIKNIRIEKKQIDLNEIFIKKETLKISLKADFTLKKYNSDNLNNEVEVKVLENRNLGEFPLMVGSNLYYRCFNINNIYNIKCKCDYIKCVCAINIKNKLSINIKDKSFCQKYLHSDYDTEILNYHNLGGYFIINGNLKILRLLIANTANIPMFLLRKHNSKRTDLTNFSIFFRSTNKNHMVSNLHNIILTTNQNVVITFFYRKAEYIVPIYSVLKYLKEFTDKEFLSKFKNKKRAIEILKSNECKSQSEIKKYFNERFKNINLKLDESIMGHLKNNEDKFNLLISLIDNLFDKIDIHVNYKNINENNTVINNNENFKILWDDLDSPSNFELQTVNNILSPIIIQCIKEQSNYIKPKNIDFNASFSKLFRLISVGTVTNYESSDILQNTGLSLTTERINFYRFISNFMNVNRGSFFQKLKISGVRKLKSESYGYLCPVNSPDGEGCGIVTHLTMNCKISADWRLEEIDLLYNNNFNYKTITNLEINNKEKFINEFKIVSEIFNKNFINYQLIKKYSDMQNLLYELGVSPLKQNILVNLNGKLIGYVDDYNLLLDTLRTLRMSYYTIIGCLNYFRQYIQYFINNLNLDSIENLFKENINKDLKNIIELIIEHKVIKNEIQFECFYKNNKIYIKNNTGRFLRKLYTTVHNKNNKKNYCGIDYVSINEQMYLNLHNYQDNIENTDNSKTKLKYYDVSPIDMLSFTAAMIPFSEHNQSPRNMYQCQMQKQSLGTYSNTLYYNNKKNNKEGYIILNGTKVIHNKNKKIVHKNNNLNNILYNKDYIFNNQTKTYSLMYPQNNIIHTSIHESYKLDTHPLGVNCIIGILSYTGYDMEDALIINKISSDHGLLSCIIYKTQHIPISNTDRYELMVNEGDILTSNKILLKLNDTKSIRYSSINSNSSNSNSSVTRVDKILISSSSVTFVLKEYRKTNVGDKFSSRHGQKGVCSYIYSGKDLIFNGDGENIDLIINPNAFPSRMTIGMMIECILNIIITHTNYNSDSINDLFNFNKSNTIDSNIKNSSEIYNFIKYNYNNKLSDATPFKYSYKNDIENKSMDKYNNIIEVINYMTKKLNLSSSGTRDFYSGTTGNLLKVKIFSGPVYYQRLRHMSIDKYQCRTIGKISPLTGQPVGGRSRGGGIRFGEMERDCLISHGTAALVSDRMRTSSDECMIKICRKCERICDGSVYCLYCTVDSKINNNNYNKDIGVFGSEMVDSINLNEIDSINENKNMVGNIVEIKGSKSLSVLIGELKGLGVDVKIKLKEKN